MGGLCLAVGTRRCRGRGFRTNHALAGAKSAAARWERKAGSLASLVDDRLIDESAYEPTVMDKRPETLSHENCREILLGIDPKNRTR